MSFEVQSFVLFYEVQLIFIFLSSTISAFSVIATKVTAESKVSRTYVYNHREAMGQIPTRMA